jgi:hypothetical protein
LDAHVALLGKVPDAEVAKLAGVTAENVRTYRHRRGIPALWQPDVSGVPTLVPAVTAEKVDKVEKVVRGTRRASAAADAPKPAALPGAGDTAPTVTDAPDANGTPAPAVAPGDGESGTAYVVVVETPEGQRTYALVAADIAAAAATAAFRVNTRHPGGSIRSIQRVAEVFPQ